MHWDCFHAAFFLKSRKLDGKGLSMIKRLGIKLNSKSGFNAFALGAAVTTLFYFIIHQPYFHGSVLHTYTTQHLTEYAIVVLFFWANAEHFLAYWSTSRERRLFEQFSLPARSGLEDPARAGELLREVKAGAGTFQGTMTYRRVIAALRFVFERRTADGYREYLETLAERDAEEVHANYGFSRFVTAILPILGLIGTVVHFGEALSGLSFEGLTERLPELLGGMGTAFNTTCAAMSALAITLLVRFWVERRENGVVLDLNGMVEDQLLYRFKSLDSNIRPFVEAISESQKSMLIALFEFEQKLAEDWGSRLSSMQEQAEKADERQQANLVQFLGVFEQRQKLHVKEVQKLNGDLVLAQQMMNDIATSLVADGQLLKLQDNLAQNMALLGQAQQFENAMHELTAAIHLFTARQHAATPRSKAA